MTVKHGDLIRAALDGEEIQWRSPTKKWKDFQSAEIAIQHLAGWPDAYDYRIAPPPDKEVYRVMWKTSYDKHWADYPNKMTTDSKDDCQLKLTYDGETGKLKSAEVVE